MEELDWLLCFDNFTVIDGTELEHPLKTRETGGKASRWMG